MDIMPVMGTMDVVDDRHGGHHRQHGRQTRQGHQDIKVKDGEATTKGRQAEMREIHGRHGRQHAPTTKQGQEPMPRPRPRRRRRQQGRQAGRDATQRTMRSLLPMLSLHLPVLPLPPLLYVMLSSSHCPLFAIAAATSIIATTCHCCYLGPGKA